jgi:hypothetical protein
MMTNSRQLAGIVFILMSGLLTSLAQAAEMIPARIGEHDKSLAKQIDFPNVPGDYTLFVRCEAKVLPAGNIEEIACYNNKDVDDAFFRAIQMAANNATVEPATVEGENVSLLMLFTVIFRQQEDNRVIAVVPNHGTNAQELGISYIAPQRYGRSIQYTPRTELGLLWIDAKMSSTGELTDVQYIKTQWSNKEAERYAKSYVRDCKFIPGHQNNQPVAMRFVKPIYGYRGGFTWDTEDTRCRDSLVSCDETSRTTGKPRFVFED